MSEFQFITTSTDPKLALQDAKSRRLIRTTATRATRSHKVQELSQRHHAQSNVVRETSQRGAMTKFRSNPPKKKTAKKEVTAILAVIPPATNLRVSVWDPVITPLGGEAWDLLHYYRYLFRANSWAINAKRDWFAFIIEDQAATHATLSFVSLNRDLEEGTVASVTTLHHRSKALQLVRQRLESEKAFLDDSLIGAIALLSLTEGLEGQSASSAAHVEALTNLVKLRGGFKKLYKNEALCRLVAWADLCHTSTFSSKPQVPEVLLLESSDVDSQRITPNDVEMRAFQSAVQAIMFPEMYNLIQLLAAVPQYSPTEETSAAQRQKTSRLIHYMNQLLLSIHSEDSTFPSDTAAKLSKVLSFATHLYITLVLRQMPKRTKAVLERSEKLKDALADLRQDAPEEVNLKVLTSPITLWARTIYFCSILPDERTEAMVSELKQTIGGLDIENHQSWESYLGRISWMRGYCEADLKAIFLATPGNGV